MPDPGFPSFLRPLAGWIAESADRLREAVLAGVSIRDLLERASS